MSRALLALATIWLAAAWLVAGCSFSGSSSGPGGDPDPVDAGADDPDAADIPAIECGGPAVYIDTFDGPEAGAQWNVFAGANLTINGDLAISPTSTQNPAGVTAGALIDLTGDRVSVEVPTHFTAGSGREASFVLARAADRFFGFHMSGDTLTVEMNDGDVQDVFTSTALDRAAHRFLALREEGGQVIWETSPDGVNWSTFTSAAAPPYVVAARIQILAIDGGGANDPIRFDNLNGGRTPEPWCAASSFEDSLDDNVIDPRWLSIQADNLCAGNVETSNLVIGLTGGVAIFDTCGLRSAPMYSLVEESITVEVLPSADDQVERYLNIHHDSGAFFGFSHSSNGLCGYAIDAESSSIPFGNCINYNRNLTFWRIRGSGGNVVLEVSADNATYMPITSQPAPFPLDAIDVAFGIFANTGSVTGTTHTVLHVNP